MLENIQPIFIFLIVLSVLIIVHEWGHFITAKMLGVDVEEFALGFGPTLFSKRFHGTNYMLKLFPLGGYVRMLGDERQKCTGRPQEFYSKSPGARALIVLNGPVVNFLLAYISFVFVFMLGYPDLSPKIGKLIDGYPAQTAHLEIGDQILRVNDQRIESWSDIQKNVVSSKGQELQVVFLRNKQEMTATIVPKVERRKNIFGQSQEVSLIGIVPMEEFVALKYNFTTSAGKAFEKLVEITTMTCKAIYFMLTGSMSAKENVTGPIGIFYIIKAAAELGFANLLYIVGVISASLAIFNLLPIIPLDGGHLFLLGVEKIRGNMLQPKVEEYVARFGFTLIMLLALFVFYSDFSRFGWFEKIKQILPF